MYHDESPVVSKKFSIGYGSAWPIQETTSVVSVTSPELVVFEVPEAGADLFCDCLIYQIKREGHRLPFPSFLYSHPVISIKNLGAWPSQEHSILPSVGLLRFLRDTKLDNVVLSVKFCHFVVIPSSPPFFCFSSHVFFSPTAIFCAE